MDNANDFRPIRVFFSKKGDAIYISHLDLTRCMQRCIKRSGIPIWYTQGFHPHQYMTFALPLALGYESECESMDIRLTEEMDLSVVMELLNAALPRDIRVLRVTQPKMDPKEIAFAEYEAEVSFACDSQGEKFLALLEQDQILVSKRTKKGPKDVDLKPLLELLSWEEREGALHLSLRLPAGSTLNLNPTLLFDAFCRAYQCETAQWKVRRTRVLTANFTEFC
ncbi:TIGR03936 family radical SAM-associated protein [Zongyangia hominis]|uniref:DUF2344 domain-containing protein n=1 Tax=Zongyangia hominis TaxID=2763677 RepID=A0A926ECD3_9FIRM|nr:TIGR03936 family radical SAM-associated protein [Zongyangia hominis]MBC8569541.1 DUF2344 domain-containing protein [Zongyangia hominis]